MRTPRPNGFERGAGPPPAYILAGGHSRRFGRDKARAVIDDASGVPWIVGLADSLRGFVSSITVVARKKSAYDDLGLRTIGDVVRNRGPIGGILTAIEDYGHSDGWVFISACDWVGIRGDWIGELLAGTDAVRRTRAQVVVFKSQREQPLFGLYHASLRPVLADRIAGGRLTTVDLLNDVEVTRVAAPLGWDAAVNLNHAHLAPRFQRGG